MIIYPAVIVHGLADAKVAVAPGAPVTLLSAPGAVAYGGCLWWLELVKAARVHAPDTKVMDILDCADCSGLAMGALRSGICRLVLWPGAPGRDAVSALALSQDGFVLPHAPKALDLAQRYAIRRLHAWLLDPDAASR